MNEPQTLSGRLTISAFAQHSRLTLKALRLYDALGLLQPAVKDPASGYRYYAPAQVQRARLIGLLRQLDMPLTRIASVLALEGRAAVNALRSYGSELEREAETKRALIQYLAGSLLGQGDPMYKVQVRDVPEQQVVTLQRHTYVRDLPEFTMQAQHELFSLLTEAGLQPSGPGLVIFHGQVNEDSDGPVEVCVPYRGQAPQPRGEQRIRVEGAHREAFTTITLEQCQFPHILEAYDAVQAFLQEQQLDMSGSPREVYFTSHVGLAPTDPFCDIAWPVK